MKLETPLKEYAEFGFANLSEVSVTPESAPLFPCPLSSFALPLKG
jgi:hypothetical protein